MKVAVFDFKAALIWHLPTQFLVASTGPISHWRVCVSFEVIFFLRSFPFYLEAKQANLTCCHRSSKQYTEYNNLMILFYFYLESSKEGMKVKL